MTQLLFPTHLSSIIKGSLTDAGSGDGNSVETGCGFFKAGSNFHGYKWIQRLNKHKKEYFSYNL